MKAIRKINNNIALCIDGRGNEVIAFGKGIGFETMPYDVPLAKVQRTYYNVDSRFWGLLEELPEKIFEISDRIIETAKLKVSHELSPNIVFSLADHIYFAVERTKKGMHIKMPFAYDIEHLYPVEMELGRYAVRLVGRELKMPLPKSEEIGIALHFINNIAQASFQSEDEVEIILENIADILERELQICINRSGFEFYRFCCHLRYFIKRVKEGRQVEEQTISLHGLLEECDENILNCARSVTTYMTEIYGAECSREETAYLIIYLIRLYNNERKQA